MEERRKLERFNLALPATIETQDPKPGLTGTSVDSLTRDLSSGGAFFLTRDPLPPGTCVAVEVDLKAEKLRRGSSYPQMKASGYVVRTEPAGMAVCFRGRCRLVPCRQRICELPQ
jgi:hypothetical protein